MTSLTVMFSSIFCSVFPFTNDRGHSVHEFLSMPTFSDENGPVKLKGARPLGRSGRGTWRGNLGNEWVIRVSPLFQLPRSPTSQEVMFLTIQVKGSTQEFKKRTTVLVKNEESLVFVQTDKPIYKPEQTGTEACSQNNFPKERSSSLACFPVKGILVP